jgi:5,10-methylenetetrahydrofolate reductase
VAALAEEASVSRFRELRALPLWIAIEAPERIVAAILAQLEYGPATIAHLAIAVRASSGTIAQILGTLAKMGLVRFSQT